jgi:hypothetical protein
MTDDKALCTAIKAWGYSDIVHGRKTRGEALREAADRIEAQAAEIERLREALRFYTTDHANPNEGPWGVDSKDFGNVARAALGETDR